jgi:hypothetical protein
VTRSAAFFAAGAVALGHAIQLRNGFYGLEPLLWLTLALICVAAGVLRPTSARDWHAAVIAILLLGIGWQLATLIRASPAHDLHTQNLRPFRIGIALEAVIMAAGILPMAWSRGRRWWWFPLLTVVHLFLGWWLIVSSPSPQIDVVTVTNAAWNALRHGNNPYAATFADIYGAGTTFYAPGSVVNGRVQFGYPYPPVTLLMVIPGYLLGDYRYALLAAIVGTAYCIAYARPSLEAKLAAVLFLTTPRVFFVLEQGWSEPVSLLLTTLAVFVMVRRPGGAGWIAGLAIASKQYLVAGLPLLWEFLRARVANPWRMLALALVPAAIVTAVFFVWGPRVFLDDLVLLQAREPFRRDALSYLVWISRQGFGPQPAAWTLVAMVASLAIAMKHSDRGPASFASSLAFVTFVTFAFGKKAFCNYYFLVIGLLCCAVAASDMLANKRRTTDEPPLRPRP